MTGVVPEAKVLRLITRLNIGGPARQALLLTRELRARFPTTLAAGVPPAVEGELSHPDVPVHRVPLCRPVRPQDDVRALRAVRRLLAETGATVLHTHMAKAGSVGRLAALSVHPRPRTVHSFHGHVLDGYFTPSVQRAFVEVERRLARRTDVLVAVSEEIRDSLLDLGIGRPEQYRVIALGLELEPFLAVDRPSGKLRQALDLGPEVPLVGTVGRLAPIKDVETLLAAIALLPDTHLAVVGDGELRARLEGRARELGLGSRVHFTGWWSDVPAALSDMDVVALTSRNEGTPVSLIEAASTGRPVVATGVGGVPRVVEDGVTGYLVRPGQPQEVADRLSRLLGDPAERGRMGQVARSRAGERFSSRRLVAEMGELYSELAGAAAPGSPRWRRVRARD